MLSSSPKSPSSSFLSKSPLSPAAVSLASPKVALANTPGARPLSDFDAGLNSSAAWTEHLEREGTSLSDEDPDDNPVEKDEPSRPARALYAFEGKPEFSEISVAAGDELEVIKEELQDGWSFVRRGREVGLLPRSYFIFTAEFVQSPDVKSELRRLGSSSSITPRNSPRNTTIPGALVPQNTGEWIRALPSFRNSLLGGKSLNRFSAFVTSGAEAFVLNGASLDDDVSNSSVTRQKNSKIEGLPVSSSHHSRFASDASVVEPGTTIIGGVTVGGEADRHFVDAGPAWKGKVPPFRVLVHSPVKQTSPLTGSYIVYSVTSLFGIAPEDPNDDPHEQCGDDPGEQRGDDREGTTTRITVHRRFSHFVAMHTALVRRLPGLALPPLPEKQYAGRFSNDFVEARRGDLERYISRLVRHPVVRYAEVLTFFLSCEDDMEFKKLLPQHLSLPPAGPAFYARVYHPAFNLDSEDAAEAVDRFETHTRAVGKGVQGLRSTFSRVREARIEMSKAERLLSYSLLSLITSRQIKATPATGTTEEEEEDARSRGLMNEDGAWCWREGCEECLRLTKAIQRTAETLHSVADLYDDHARRTQLATHESLKSVAHPHSTYAAVIDTHRSTLSRYSDSPNQSHSDDDVAARCETVLNTTMAEMDTYHLQKIEDFNTLAREHLDGEIAFYEQVIGRLQSARRTFLPPLYNTLSATPRQPSIFERELDAPRVPQPLPQPCPHVFDAAPMRPVTVALQDGVGMIFGTGSAGRASVFGKLWGQ